MNIGPRICEKCKKPIVGLTVSITKGYDVIFLHVECYEKQREEMGL